MSHMTLEQLRIFVAVAERQHMTRAAEALRLAQSAVSGAVHALEASFGVRLFDRVGRGIELTEAGRVFLDEARAVLARVETARLCLAELGSLKRGTLSIHASQTIASYWLPRHLVTFRRTYPAVELNMTIGNSAQVAHAVRERTTDIGFVEGDVDLTGLAVRDIARDQLIIVVAPDHPWASIGRRLEPADLMAAAWILRERGSGTRSQFEAALQEAGVEAAALPTMLELPSNEAVRAAVEAGEGTACALSASVAAPAIEAGLLCQVPFSLPVRRFSMLTHAERTASRSTDALLRIIDGETGHAS